MLPLEFTERMKSLLGSEYEAFARAMQKPAVRGLRVNTIKTSVSDFLSSTSLTLRKISYQDGGFIVEGDSEGIGSSPDHMSGRFYIQDPGAMATVAAAPIKAGMRIADLCAAPGGKSTQLASLIREDGFILCNEIVPKRAKILVGNIERLGIRNATVTSLDTGVLKGLYPGYFDLVLADAPCSGEGMFRKGEEISEEWSEAGVKLCAARQEEILDNASYMVAPGGFLLYSTCTYSTEENEQRVSAFLRSHPNFKLIPVSDAVRAVTSDGVEISDSLCTMRECRRFYPHASEGEGQFIALMQKADGEKRNAPSFKSSAKQPTKDELSLINTFFKEHLTSLPSGKIFKYNENLYVTPHMEAVPPYSVFSAGVLLGEIKGKTFVPSHQFFSAYGNLFMTRIELNDEKARLFLAGEELDAPPDASGGFCSLLYCGAPLGGGKISGGKIKNHYPKGLRIRRG